jgi:hypothetical protein
MFFLLCFVGDIVLNNKTLLGQGLSCLYTPLVKHSSFFGVEILHYWPPLIHSTFNIGICAKNNVKMF